MPCDPPPGNDADAVGDADKQRFPPLARLVRHGGLLVGYWRPPGGDTVVDVLPRDQFGYIDGDGPLVDLSVPLSPHVRGHNITGATPSSDGAFLFVRSTAGVVRIERATGAIERVFSPDPAAERDPLWHIDVPSPDLVVATHATCIRWVARTTAGWQTQFQGELPRNGGAFYARALDIVFAFGEPDETGRKPPYAAMVAARIGDRMETLWSTSEAVVGAQEVGDRLVVKTSHWGRYAELRGLAERRAALTPR